MRASQDGVTRFIVSRMLEPHHIALSAIETIRLPEAVLVSSLERGAIDAVAVSEPGLTRVSKVGTMWIKAQDVVPDFQWGVIAFGERLLGKDRETGVRFMRAYERGVEQFRGRKDRAQRRHHRRGDGRLRGAHARGLLADLPRRFRHQLGEHRAIPTLGQRREIDGATRSRAIRSGIRAS